MPVRKRQGTKQQRDTLCKKLNLYHRSLAMDLIKKSKDENVKSLIKPELGFPELQISQVLENVDKICTVEDVSSYVEIWNLKHAFKILEFITEVYGDVCELQQNDFNDDQSQYGFDHELELDEQWDDLLNGDTLFELALRICHCLNLK